MNAVTAWLLVAYISGGSAGGPIQIGPFATAVECRYAAKELSKEQVSKGAYRWSACVPTTATVVIKQKVE